jgi:C_GCAxxG_C_C family probable redox protein
MYGSCAKSSFASLNEQFELKADAIMPAVMPFTGGIAGKGETCGAVAGAILAIGFFFECVKQNEKKPAASSMRFGGLFFDRFEKEFGSTRCREVVKHQYGRYYDFNNPEDMKSFAADSKKGASCLEVVKRAAVTAGDIIFENS